jgi:acetyltransferase-like isoleucine patch superfamily enzyme
VTSDLPPGVIAVGSPARVLKEIAFQTPGELTAPR